MKTGIITSDFSLIFELELNSYSSQRMLISK